MNTYGILPQEVQFVPFSYHWLSHQCLLLAEANRNLAGRRVWDSLPFPLLLTFGHALQLCSPSPFIIIQVQVHLGFSSVDWS